MYDFILGNSKNLLASERWQIEKTRRQLNASIEANYEKSLSIAVETQLTSNKKAVEVYNKIFSRIQFGYPPLPNPYKNAVLRYCHRLLSYGTDKFRTLRADEEPLEAIEVELSVWLEKSTGNNLVRKASFAPPSFC